MNNPHIITFSDLQEIAGTKTVSGVVKFCINNNVPFVTGRGCISTSVEAYNKALGVLPNNAESDHIEI